MWDRLRRQPALVFATRTSFLNHPGVSSVKQCTCTPHVHLCVVGHIAATRISARDHPNSAWSQAVRLLSRTRPYAPCGTAQEPSGAHWHSALAAECVPPSHCPACAPSAAPAAAAALPAPQQAGQAARARAPPRRATGLDKPGAEGRTCRNPIPYTIYPNPNAEGRACRRSASRPG